MPSERLLFFNFTLYLRKYDDQPATNDYLFLCVHFTNDPHFHQRSSNFFEKSI